jgi:hypothetical protein
LLVPVATTGTNGLYKPRLKTFFPPVMDNGLYKPGLMGFTNRQHKSFDVLGMSSLQEVNLSR